MILEINHILFLTAVDIFYTLPLFAQDQISERFKKAAPKTFSAVGLQVKKLKINTNNQEKK